MPHRDLKHLTTPAPPGWPPDEVPPDLDDDQDADAIGGLRAPTTRDAARRPPDDDRDLAQPTGDDPGVPA